MLRRARERLGGVVRIERENTEASHRRKRQQRAADLWSKANPHPDPNHAYLARKGGLPPVGFARVVTPWWFPSYGADKALTGLQFIQPDGQRFITGTRKAGSWCVLKPEGIPPTDWRVILLDEGWATAASLHHRHPGHPVFIAFDCGNLSAVAR